MNANAAQVNGNPAGPSAPPDVVWDPDPNHDNIPTITLVNDGAAGATGTAAETAPTGTEAGAAVDAPRDTGNVDTDPTAPVEAPGVTALGCNPRFAPNVALREEDPPPLVSSPLAALEVEPPAAEAAPLRCLPPLPDPPEDEGPEPDAAAESVDEDPEPALRDEPDDELFDPGDVEPFDGPDVPDHLEPPDDLVPPDADDLDGVEPLALAVVLVSAAAVLVAGFGRSV